MRIDDVTEERGVLVLSGPRSRELLGLLTDANLSNEEFRWLSAREISVAGIPLRALRVSYVGELGWELHPPIGSMVPLYEALWEQGQQFGIANYGLYAVNSMRMEKGYKAWSSELTNELNMLEADMARFFASARPISSARPPRSPGRRALFESSTPRSKPPIPMHAAGSRCSSRSAASE